MIRLLVPLAIVSLGLAADQEQSQDAGSFMQAPLATVEQPQQFYYPQPQLQSFQGAAQQYVQYQPQAQQQAFYYPQQQALHQSVFYPYQPFQQLQFTPVQQPTFVMSPKLTIPTGLLRKHVNTSSDEPSVFAFSYNPETGLKVATINGKKVFAYKQGFPGALKEDVEIVENGDVKTSGNPTAVSSTSENGNGEKTKNVWFDDKDDPMVKIEKEPVGSVATTTVDPNLPVVSQDGGETTTVAPAATTTAEATTTAAAEVAAGGVTVTPVPAAAAVDATTTVAAVPATTGIAAAATTTAVPVPTTTPVSGEAFFAAQNPSYMTNVAAFSAQYPQYFPTRFAPKAFPTQHAAIAPQAEAQFAAAAPTTIAPSVAPAAYQVTPGPIFSGSGLSQVHPVYAQSAISTTQMPQVAAQYVARPVAVGVAQQEYLQPTGVPIAPHQQQQYMSTPQPVTQQYLQPVHQQAQQFVQPQQQYLQPTIAPQPLPQYTQNTALPQYYPQPETAPAPPQQQLQPQYVQQQHVQQQYQHPRYPSPAAPHPHYAPPPATPAYHGVQRPAPPQDFTEDELRPAAAAYQHNQATSTAPPSMSPDSRYLVPSQYQQANGYQSTTAEPERPSPPRYQPSPAPSRYVERPAYQPSSTPGYEAPELTTYAPRPAPSRRPYYPRRPTSPYHRPAYRQQYRRPQARPQYNPNRRVTYYRAGTQQRLQQPYHRPQYNPQPTQQAQYASPNAYSSPSQYQTTTTEAPAPGERYYARVSNADQSKVAYAENPFDNMEFQSTPVPVGQKKDVKVTFINRQRMA